MKTLFPILILLIGLSGSVSAQDKATAQNADPIAWFGIDFSAAKFVRISETAKQAKDITHSINNLILTEPNKYNLSKFFGKQTVLIDLDPVEKRNEAIELSELTSANPIKLSQEQVQEIVSSYARTPDQAKTGLVFVVENCDKAALSASVYVCFFDIASGKIIHMVETKGKPGGFGLRNYWAGAMYNIMKNWKY